MHQLILYGTLGCHLCDQAEAILERSAATVAISWTPVDIADSEQLMHEYGVRIPVVKHLKTSKELGWPFDSAVFESWLNSE